MDAASAVDIVPLLESQLDDALVTGIVLLAGLVVVVVGSVPLVRGARIWLGHQKNVGNVDDGAVHLAGEVNPTDEYDTLTSPLSGEETLLYTYEIEEYGDFGEGEGWHPVAGGSDGVPFVLDDGTGTVTVNPAGSNLFLEARTSKHVDLREFPDPGDEPGESDSADLDELVTRHDARAGRIHVGSVTLNEGSRYRLRERRIEPGDHLYVTGTAESDWDGPGSLVYDTDDPGPFGSVLKQPFVVSDYAERSSARYLLKRGTAWAGVGVVAFLLALGLESFVPVALAAGVLVGAATQSPAWCWVVTVGLLLFGQTGVEDASDPLFVGPLVVAVGLSFLASGHALLSERGWERIDRDRWQPDI